MSFALHNVPGYAEAIREAEENDFTTREDAWWNFTFDLGGGLLIRTLTVQDYELLLRQRNPLLVRQIPAPEDMMSFLWLLSPENERWEQPGLWLRDWRRERARRRHEKFCRKVLDLDTLHCIEQTHNLQKPDEKFVIPEDSAYAKVFANCIQYIDRMFYDRPAGVKRKGNASGMCYLTDWFCNLQREFHLPTAEIEKMPLPELFARLREIQAHHNPKVPDFNERADKLNRQIMDALRGGMSEADILAGKLQLRLN